jgi:hypothetical protein
LELHGLKGVSLRKQMDYTGVPHTTAHYRYKQGLRWLREATEERRWSSRVLRRQFWLEDLDTGGFMTVTAETELAMRATGTTSCINIGRMTHSTASTRSFCARPDKAGCLMRS